MSIFDKIINGEIPCYKIYEDERSFAFLDIRPMHLGHTLVVPKVIVDHFDDLHPDYICALALTCQRVAKAIKKATNCIRVSQVVLGFEVPHCHFHLIPLDGESDFDFSLTKERSENEMKKIQSDIVQYINREINKDISKMTNQDFLGA